MNRHNFVVAVCLWLMGCGVTAAGAAAESAPVAHTRSGVVQGSLSASNVVFLGIPFAASPVGELRWRAPQPVPVWSGVRKAQRFGPSCPQSVSTPTQLAPLEAFSEDCLYLNIWGPRRRQTQLPVMVWLHGGGFISGGAAEAEYDGSRLAQHGVLVVSINYRLGRLGVFAHPALDREHPEEPHGNYGLLDQVAALQWVRHNISAFGGDPRNVTVFGESAGGISIVALSTSSLAQGLFDKAIVQSGSVRLPMRELASDRPGLPSAETIGSAWAQTIGIEGGDSAVAKRLRSLPVATVAPPAPALAEVMDILKSSSPIIDGKLLVTGLDSAFQAGSSGRVPMILGTNSLESVVWSFGDSKLQTIPITSLNIDEILPSLEHKQRNEVLASFRAPGTADDIQVAESIASEALMGAGAVALARAAAPSTPVYLYRFAAVPGAAEGAAPGAPHGTEIFYVFGTLDRFRIHPEAMTSADRGLSAAIMEYWTSFARSGIPSASGAPKWAAFDSGRNELLIFTRTGAAMAPIPHIAAIDLLTAAGHH
jgi:para-nitrobenzyl esterase